MNTGFHHDRALGSALNQQAISFQLSATNSTSEMIVLGDYSQMNGSATTSSRFLGNSVMANNHSGFTQAVNSCGSVLGESVSGLKHGAGLAVEWSVDEQHKLDEGLSKFLMWLAKRNPGSKKYMGLEIRKKLVTC